MSKFSNILKVPSIADYSLNLMKRIYNKIDIANNPSQDLIININEYKKDAKIIIETISNSIDYTEKSLADITKEDKRNILTLQVISYLPNNILDFSQVFCPHCKER